MARAAEFSPWLTRWREPRAINTCRPSWTMRGCRVYIQAGFRNFLPVSVTYADQRPPICRTWNVEPYGNAMRNCDSLPSFSCSRFMKHHYLEIDRTFSETRRVCPTMRCRSRWWTLVYRPGRIRRWDLIFALSDISFGIGTVPSEKSNIFRMFWTKRGRDYARGIWIHFERVDILVFFDFGKKDWSTFDWFFWNWKWMKCYILWIFQMDWWVRTMERIRVIFDRFF